MLFLEIEVYGRKRLININQVDYIDETDGRARVCTIDDERYFLVNKTFEEIKKDLEETVRPVPRVKTILDENIEALGLSNRTLHCLDVGCIHKVWQLLDKKESDLKRIRGLGEGCYQEIISALAKHDLEIKRNLLVL